MVSSFYRDVFGEYDSDWERQNQWRFVPDCRSAVGAEDASLRDVFSARHDEHRVKQGLAA